MGSRSCRSRAYCVNSLGYAECCCFVLKNLAAFVLMTVMLFTLCDLWISLLSLLSFMFLVTVFS